MVPQNFKDFILELQQKKPVAWQQAQSFYLRVVIPQVKLLR